MSVFGFNGDDSRYAQTVLGRLTLAYFELHAWLYGMSGHQPEAILWKWKAGDWSIDIQMVAIDPGTGQKDSRTVSIMSIGDPGAAALTNAESARSIFGLTTATLRHLRCRKVEPTDTFFVCDDPWAVHGDDYHFDFVSKAGNRTLCEGCHAIRRQREDRKRARSRMSRSLRFKVLRRDDFRCRACGSTADDADLEVDHILPVSMGGKSRPGNLQTLCRDCNRGKSDRRVPEMEPDGGIPISEMPRHWRYRFKGGDYWYCKTHNEVSGVPF